jgi:hypothetical protein
VMPVGMGVRIDSDAGASMAVGGIKIGTGDGLGDDLGDDRAREGNVEGGGNRTRLWCNASGLMSLSQASLATPLLLSLSSLLASPTMFPSSLLSLYSSSPFNLLS